MRPENFKNTYSRLVINEPDTGSNNILADWDRAASGHERMVIKIDGQPLSYPEGYFLVPANMENFFETVILAKLPQGRKKEITAKHKAFLMLIFPNLTITQVFALKAILSILVIVRLKKKWVRVL